MDIRQILVTGMVLLLSLVVAEDSSSRKEKRGLVASNPGPLYTSALLGGHSSISGLSQSIEIPIQHSSLPQIQIQPQIAYARPVKYIAVPRPVPIAVPISYYQAPVSYSQDSYSSAGPQVSYSQGGGGGYSYSNGDSYSNGGDASYSNGNAGYSYPNNGDSYSNNNNGGGSYSHGDSYSQIVHGPLRGVYIPSSEGGLYGHEVSSGQYSGWKGGY